MSELPFYNANKKLDIIIHGTTFVCEVVNICTYGAAQQPCLQAVRHSKYEQHGCILFLFEKLSSPRLVCFFVSSSTQRRRFSI